MEAKELAQQYSDDLKPLRAIYSFLRDRRDNYLALATECEEQGEWSLAEEFNADYIEYRQRCKEVGSIISSSQFSIKWLRQGFEPRGGGVSKLPYTKREVLTGDVDEALTYLNVTESQYESLTVEEVAKMDDYLNILTPREKDVFLSIKGKGNTYKQTAAYLQISKGSVREYLRRAEDKLLKGIDQGVQTALF